MRHTPGPWTADRGLIYPPDTEQIGAVAAMSGKNQIANARLIAAAPDLLAACKELLLLVEEMMPGVRHIALQNYQRLNEAPIAARRAIKEAEGQK